jgi:DNA modification methylase
METVSLIKCSFAKLLDILSPEIIPHPKNMNRHPEEQIIRLAKLIKFQGQRHPIIISRRSGFIVAGHGRWEALKLLKKENGWDSCAIDYQEFESEAQEYAFMTSDNAIQEWADLDLSMVNTEMLDFGPDFDVDLLGIKDFTVEPVEKFEAPGDPDNVPEVKFPITRKGDLWTLGNHRLLCGDSTLIDDVEKLMGGVKADMVFTDPPYNVNYESDHTGKIQNDNMSDGDFEQFIRMVYSNLDMFTAKNSSIYIAHATMVIEFDTVLREFDWKISNKIIWVKDIPTYSMARFKWKYEPIYFVTKGTPVFNGDKKETNVWEFKSIQSAGNSDESGNTWFKGGAKNLTLHPTQKPWQLVEKAVTLSSNEKQVVLDLFGGSGSTMIACEKSHRKNYTMELDEKFCDVIIKRWEGFTGLKAVLQSTGQTCEELKIERDGAAQE